MSSSLTSSSALPTQSSSTWVPPSNGVVGGYQGDNQTILRAMTAFAAIAWFSAGETLFLIFIRFKQYEGLYFWSLLLTSFAVIVYELGSWGNMLQIANPTLLFVILQNVGWITMVTGQSLVLYSRLYIITFDRRVLKFVLWMIIIDSAVLYVPTTALNFGTIVNLTRPYVDGYNIMERIQMIIFSIQELMISGIYLWEVRSFVKVWQEDTQKLMFELVIVNILLILLDVALLSVEFLNLYMIETTLKGMVYAIKLKLEIGVLSKMVKIATLRKESRTMPTREEDINLRKYSSATTAKDFFTSPFKRDSHEAGSSSENPGQQPIQSTGDVLDIAPKTSENSTAPYPLSELPNSSARLGHSRASSIQDMYPGRLTG